MTQRRIFLPTFLAALLLSGCHSTATSPLDSRSNLAKAAQALSDVATATDGGVKLVIQLQTANSLTVEETRSILAVFQRVALAGKQATAITRKLNALDPASKVSVSQIVGPVIATFRAGVANGLFAVKNADSKSKLAVYLMSIEASFALLDLVLA